MSDPEFGSMLVEGDTKTDGDCVYVNGMSLASVLRAAVPHWNGEHGRLRIAVTKEEKT